MESEWGHYDERRKLFQSDTRGPWRIEGLNTDDVFTGRLQLHGRFDESKRVVELDHYSLPEIEVLPPVQRTLLILTAPFKSPKAYLLQAYLLLSQPPIDEIIIFGDMPEEADDFSLAEAFLNSLRRYQITLVTQDMPFPRKLIPNLRTESEPLSAQFGGVVVKQVAGLAQNCETTWRQMNSPCHVIVCQSPTSKVWKQGVWIAAVGPFDDTATCVCVGGESGTILHFD